MPGKADSNPKVIECNEHQRERDADCLHCVVRDRMLFADVDVASVEVLLKPIKHIWHPANSVLFREGEDPAALYSIRKGVIKLSMNSEDGDLRIVRLVGPGATIGLETLLDQPYQNYAESLTAVDVCRLPVAVVKELATRQPGLCKQLLLQCQAQLTQADAHLVELSMGSVKEKVQHLFLIISKLCAKGGTDFLLPTNADIAALVAAREESVSRVVAAIVARLAACFCAGD